MKQAALQIGERLNSILAFRFGTDERHHNRSYLRSEWLSS